MIRAHILFSGRVQGVGFRATAQGYAQDLNLCGWVKNLPNGRVEILAEGDREKITQLCQNLEKYFQGYIKDKNIDFVPAQKNYSDFDIAF